MLDSRNLAHVFSCISVQLRMVHLYSKYFQESSGAADDSNEDEENDVTVEDVDTPTGQLS